MSASDWQCASPSTRDKFLSRNQGNEAEAIQDFFLRQLGDAYMFVQTAPLKRAMYGDKGVRKYCDTLRYIQEQGWFANSYPRDIRYMVVSLDGTVHPSVLQDVEDIPTMDAEDVLAQLRAQIPFETLITERTTLQISEWFHLTDAVQISIRVLLHARGSHVSAYYRSVGTNTVDALPHHLCTLPMNKHRLYWSLKRFQESQTACVGCGRVIELYKGACIDCFRTRPEDAESTRLRDKEGLILQP
jgi:hypothetical protein